MQSMGFDSHSTILDPTALASNEANPSSISENIFSLSKQEDCGVENLTFVSKKDGNFVVAVSKSQKIHARRICFCSVFVHVFMRPRIFIGQFCQVGAGALIERGDTSFFM